MRLPSTVAVLAASLLAVVAAGVAAPAAVAAKPVPYASKVQRLTPAVKELMIGRSWREGCPVGLRDLRLVTVRYWSFKGKPRDGQLVVHRTVAPTVAAIFKRLYRLKYPVRRIRLVDVYGASDYRSIEADNTSAFNCRYVDGTTRWSNHAYGKAIDINPIENPYVGSSGTTSHRASRPYLDRSRHVHPAQLLRGDPAVAAFTDRGWGWGGLWSGVRDYQHFSADGR